MRVETLLAAIGGASDEYKNAAAAKFKDSGGREAVFTVFRIAAAVLSVIFIIGFAVYTWYLSVISKDPPRPAVTGEPYVTETETAEREPETEPETENSLPSLPDNYDSLSAEEKAAALFKRMGCVNYGNKADPGDVKRLKALGDDALRYCVEKYNNSDAERIPMSMLVSEAVRDEFEKLGESLTRGLGFIGFDAEYENGMEKWYGNFRTLAAKYAANHDRDYIRKTLPVTYKILTWHQFADYKASAAHVPVENLIRSAIAARSLASLQLNVRSDGYVFTKEDVHRLKELCGSGTDAEKVLAAYAVYQNAYNYMIWRTADDSDLFASYAAGGPYLDYVLPQNGEGLAHEITYGELVEADPGAARWLSDFMTAAKAEAAKLYREEFAEYCPQLYVYAEYDGFDGYKNGSPDIAFDSHAALQAAIDLYNAKTCGTVPDDPYFGITYGFEYECGLDEFTSYFKRYIDGGTVDAYIKTAGTGTISVKNGRITLYTDGTVYPIILNSRSARLTSQSGDEAVVAATVRVFEHYTGWGAAYYDSEFTFELKKTDGGVVITGGTFVENMLSSAREAVSKPVLHTVSLYMILREGRLEYNESRNLINEYKAYITLPEKYRPLVTEEAEFPVYIFTSEKISGVSDAVFSALTKPTDSFDGTRLYPEKGRKLTEPAFGHGITVYEGTDYSVHFELTQLDIIAALEPVTESDTEAVYSLDFYREENGARIKKTYTFEFEITAEPNGYETYTLTGGSFLTELLMK